YIERRLKQLAAHSYEWSQEKVFEEAVKLFSAITVHLEKKETLLTDSLSALDEELTVTLKEATRHRYEIEAQIESLTQMHVDESNFRKGMESLLRRVINHRKFCEDKFFPVIETHLSKADRANIDSKFVEMVFS